MTRVSPIFVRPVREQLEHDRLIRHLQPKYKRKYDEVATNPGDEQLVPIKIAAGTYYPDLVLTDGKKLAGIVEIETGESVNNLEAMYQWGPFSKARVPFHLYVPVQGYDAARRLIEANQAKITEVWTYRPANDGFDLVRMFADASVSAPKASKPVATPAAKVAAAAKPAPVKVVTKPAAKPAKPAPKPAAKPAAKAAPAKPVKKVAKAKPVAKASKAAKSAKPVAKTKTKKGPAGRKGK